MLRGLAAAVAPGGWLLVEDFDWVATTLVDPPSAVHERVASACTAPLEAHGYDAGYGRRLPRAFRAAGLAAVGTSASSAQVDADPVRGIRSGSCSRPSWLPGCSPPASSTRRDLQEFGELLHDGDSVVFAPLMVSTWGRRAGPPERTRRDDRRHHLHRGHRGDRAVRRFAATGVGDWLFANVLRRLDGPVHRITSGRSHRGGPAVRAGRWST